MRTTLQGRRPNLKPKQKQYWPGATDCGCCGRLFVPLRQREAHKGLCNECASKVDAHESATVMRHEHMAELYHAGMYDEHVSYDDVLFEDWE